MKKGLNRREIIKISLYSLSALAFRWKLKGLFQNFQPNQKLGRLFATAEIKAKPDMESATIKKVYEDNIVIWLREVTGSPRLERPVQRWVETPEGYIWSPMLQPVYYRPNTPVETLPSTSKGPGMWMQVTVPYVDIVLENPPARSPWLKAGPMYPRLYYSQILWIDQIRKAEGEKIYYRVNELYGTYGDRFWADATAFRPLTEEEISPITPEVEDKKVVVDVTFQTLGCFEGNNEVYFCRVSTGAKFNEIGQPVKEWATPVGKHHTWRKIISTHMAGGTASGGYDIPGIAWTILFASGGVAIHSTFWHNNFGVPMSHGCVNAMPEDAKWIFRWTTPIVSYDPGDITVSMPGGTPVFVVEK